MKVLVTGAGGQLGREFVLLLQDAGMEAVALTRNELDLTAAADTIADTIAIHQADWIVNCAAYTQVDRAESEPELAYAVNRDAAAAIAEGARRGNGRLLQVSTDFVFGGDKSSPYREDDSPAPLGVYGASKLAGEQAVLEVLPSALILRTAWVYGCHGHNFVKTILRVAGERDELHVVDDQIGTPAWTRDIAGAMLALMRAGAEGAYHFTNEGVASWYDFALAVLELGAAQGFGIKARTLQPIPTADYPTPARRPAYSVLSKAKIRPLLPGSIPHWRTSLSAMLQELSISS
ncbi:NAD(P)-dependent oxidoreductase [Thiohalobacter sp. COW1]|uniref:dTDP-4-dehydrorhamnose reductase n=1 Tax=Thiohalobacter sp. COW1 TaxID=2795687 RepID=UPI001915EF30|nr:dTDP-4-dehydrorhamnose reductase [Thiohalobacter sp. COW1]BCO32018.1 NAD(P)-dependent oxidoreductase [Thiohalobacter sp. COW1]